MESHVEGEPDSPAATTCPAMLLLGNRDVLAHVALFLGNKGTLRLLATSTVAKRSVEADDVVFLALRNALLAKREYNGATVSPSLTTAAGNSRA